MEEIIGDRENFKKKKHTRTKQEIRDMHKSIQLMMPRDVQNANSLVFSQINLNKYSWNNQGEKILSIKKLNIDKDDKRILKFLFLKKIPENKRGDIWLLTSGAKREMLNNPNYYKNLTENFPKNIPSPYSEQIEMDLKRTFPEEVEFEQDHTLNKLRNILLAYSRRNISIGYCQGFNFIVGRLIKVFKTEEEAFWVFVQIVEQILPLNYFSNLAGAMVDSAIFNKLFQIYLPDLYFFLIDIGYEMQLNTIIFKWFVGLYSNYLPQNLCLIIWDVFFLEGCITLFKAAIGIFKTLKKEIMSQTSIEKVQNIIEVKAIHLIDASSIIYYIILRRFEFDMQIINKNRNIFETNIIENYFKHTMDKMNIERNNLISESKNKKREEVKRNSYFSCYDCHVEWPLCIFDTYYKHDITKFFLYRTFDQPAIIDNYFFGYKTKNLGCSTGVISSEFLSDKSLNGSINSNEISILVEKEKYTQKKPIKSNLQKKNHDLTHLLTSGDKIFVEGDSNLDSESNEEKFNLVIEKIEESPVTNEKANLSFQSCDNIMEKLTIDKLVEKPDYLHFNEEKKKLKIFETLLIERRSHYCLLFPEKIKEKEYFNTSDIISENKKEKEKVGLRNTMNYGSLLKRKDLTIGKCNTKGYKDYSENICNKSFTALHPYFIEIKDDLIHKNGLIYSNFISEMRQTSKQVQHPSLLDSLTFPVNPLKDEDLDHMYDNEEYGSE